MMTNLFSIFDPSTSVNLSLNWLSIPLIILFTQLPLFFKKNRMSAMMSSLMTYIFKEFSMILKKYPFTLMIPLTSFMFIMLTNVAGLMPYIFTSTSHLSTSVSMAVPAWVALMLYALINNYSNLLIHLVPQGTPSMLMPLMVVIETISSMIRPITLAVRMSANMIAGHLLVTLLSSATSFTPHLFMPLLGLSQLLLMLLEVAVAIIQAYVFSVLVTLYVAESTN